MKPLAVNLKKKYFLLLFCLSLIVPASFCVAQSADSLEQVLATKNLPADEKITIYKELASSFVNDSPDKCAFYCRAGLQLVKKQKDESAKAVFLYYLGSAHYRNGMYDSAKIIFDEALTVTQNNQDKKGMGSVYQGYARLYRKQAQYNTAIDYYLKAVEVYDELNDEMGVASAYIGMGGAYQLMKNYEQALVHFKKAEKIALQNNSPKLLSDIYISYVDIFSRLEYDQDTVLHFAKELLRMQKEAGTVYGEIDALQTIANSYFFYDDYPNAIRYADSAIHLSEQIKNPFQTAFSLMVLSNIYFSQEQYKKSVTSALQAMRTDSTDYNLNVNIYSKLASGYAYLGKADSVWYYMDKAQEILIDHSNTSYQNSLSEMEVKYQTEKKSIQISALQKQKQLYLWLGIIGGLMLLSALFIALMRYRLAVNRRKLAEEKSQRLEQENQLVAVQAALDGESAERTRLAKDLHDGLGSMLSLVKFNMPQVNDGVVLEDVDVSRFQKALGMLDASIQELRRVAHHMMPESLLRYGLKNSLSDFCAAIPNARFHYFGDEARLPGKLEIMIYRSIHELVNNALKHADANQINVQLVQQEDRISFIVQDDGKGYNRETVKEGMGLQNIRQRVAAFQGKMEIHSSEEGTEIHVELNLKKNEKHD